MVFARLVNNQVWSKFCLLYSCEIHLQLQKKITFVRFMPIGQYFYLFTYELLRYFFISVIADYCRFDAVYFKYDISDILNDWSYFVVLEHSEVRIWKLLTNFMELIWSCKEPISCLLYLVAKVNGWFCVGWDRIIMWARSWSYDQLDVCGAFKQYWFLSPCKGREICFTPLERRW